MIGGVGHSARAFQTMEALRRKEMEKEPVERSDVRKRIPFTNDELQIIAKHFKRIIKAHVTPSLKECRKFLASSSINRDEKQIQDRVKNFIKG